MLSRRPAYRALSWQGYSPQHPLGVNDLENSNRESPTCSCGSALLWHAKPELRSRHPPCLCRGPQWPPSIPASTWRAMRSAARDVMVQLLGVRHACYGHWKPAAGHDFSSAEPDLRLASRRILSPYCLRGWLAGCFSLSISHASGAWSSEMRPRGGSPFCAARSGHMTWVTHESAQGNNCCILRLAEKRNAWALPHPFRREYPVRWRVMLYRTDFARRYSGSESKSETDD